MGRGRDTGGAISGIPDCPSPAASSRRNGWPADLCLVRTDRAQSILGLPRSAPSPRGLFAAAYFQETGHVLARGAALTGRIDRPRT